ncbi:CAP domain-containing protein [Iamia sp. SCSIO 61187]|uniref:CAP domain-containing protein n=1 Tax=Iamia sp. SCSIO 61187 TaxID=2722752 RepID=UPI001C62717E|nr:CAP domain-containing protein [Iamia sp. SCSIO 61187]QYG93549.1 CAP domain-containing protein [Iamia sp. SCSIO 61187]
MTNMTNVTKRSLRRPTSRIVLAGVAVLVALLLAACLTSGQDAVLRELNSDRRAHGLASLPAHGTLTAKAQAWAEKMAREGRLSHSNLASGAPRCWQRLGENVGYGSSAAAVQDAFMRSSGHRANVLGRWTDVGVGYAKAGNRVYVVQVFMVRC